jgi:peroxin-19
MSPVSVKCRDKSSSEISESCKMNDNVTLITGTTRESSHSFIGHPLVIISEVPGVPDRPPSSMSELDMDSLLDSAFYELDAASPPSTSSSKASAPGAPTTPGVRSAAAAASPAENKEGNSDSSSSSSSNDSTVAPSLDELRLVAQLSGIKDTESLSYAELDAALRSKTSAMDPPMPDQKNKSSLDKAMDMISSVAKNAQSSMGAGGGGNENDMLEKLFAQFEQLSREEGGGGGGLGGLAGGEGGMDGVIEKMMSELMSKEYLYEPMKDVCERYPTWLKDNKSKVTAEDFAKYEQQYSCFQKIMAALDEVPENKEKLFALMTEMQNYGPPPQELVGDLMGGMAGLIPGLGVEGGPGGRTPLPGMAGSANPFEALLGGAGAAGSGPGGMPTEAQMKEMEKLLESSGGCPTQ